MGRGNQLWLASTGTAKTTEDMEAMSTSFCEVVLNPNP